MAGDDDGGYMPTWGPRPTPTLHRYEGPVCLRCAHRHAECGPCASHVWGDECEYQAGDDCPTTTRPPVPTGPS